MNGWTDKYKGIDYAGRMWFNAPEKATIMIGRDGQKWQIMPVGGFPIRGFDTYQRAIAHADMHLKEA